MSASTSAAVDEAVLDTNVLLDWLVFDDPATKPLAQALDAGRLRWVATRPMWDELVEVLRRAFPSAWSRQAATALGRAEPYCCRVERPVPTPACTLRCTDPGDQMFIDLALARPTPWLISRDKALLRLAGPALRRQVRVVQPEQWAAIVSDPGRAALDE